MYVSDPPGGTVFNPTPASETITMGLRGDCDDFAVLLAALVQTIGGHTRIIIARSSNSAHAFAEVYAGRWGKDTQSIIDYIWNRYGLRSPSKVWFWVYDNGDAWLNLDWQACNPGGAYYEGERWLTIYPWNDGRFHPLVVKGEAMDTTPSH